MVTAEWWLSCIVSSLSHFLSSPSSPFLSASFSSHSHFFPLIIRHTSRLSSSLSRSGCNLLRQENPQIAPPVSHISWRHRQIFIYIAIMLSTSKIRRRTPPEMDVVPLAQSPRQSFNCLVDILFLFSHYVSIQLSLPRLSVVFLTTWPFFFVPILLYRLHPPFVYTRVLCTAKGLRVSSPRINFVIFILFVTNDMVCVSIAINAMMFPYFNSEACKKFSIMEQGSGWVRPGIWTLVDIKYNVDRGPSRCKSRSLSSLPYKDCRWLSHDPL